MDAHAQALTQLINEDVILDVPFYQRAYVWEAYHWERFLSDIEFVCSSNMDHFFGAVILMDEGVESEKGTLRYSIVDGQQRLTTFLIFLKALSLKTGGTFFFERFLIGNEYSIPVLQLGKKDAPIFEKIVLAKNFEELQGIGSDSKILEAFNYFKENIDTSKIDYLKLRGRSKFVCITLVKGENEQQIFDSLNSLGVNLTTSELLKNYFYDRKDIEAYKEQWEDLFENENDSESRTYWNTELEVGSRRAMVDLFFESYFQIFIQDKNRFPKITSAERQAYEKLDMLAQSYKDFIGRHCNGDKNVVLSQMKDYANCFKEIFQPKVFCQSSLTGSFGTERLNVVIFGLQNTTLIPYVLYLAMKLKDNKEVFNKMCGILESYIMRRMVVRATTKNYNRFFKSLISNSVDSVEKLLDQLHKNSEEASDIIPSDEELLNAFKMNYKLTNLQAKGILYLIESKNRSHGSSTALLGFNQYSLEHLMPKKWPNNWDIPATDEGKRLRNIKMLTMGNLAIITQVLNASIRDSKWETKLEGRGNNFGLKTCAQGLYTFYEILNKKSWSEPDIDERAQMLFDDAKDVWKL